MEFFKNNKIYALYFCVELEELNGTIYFERISKKKIR